MRYLLCSALVTPIMKSITYMLILFLLVSQGIQAKAIPGEVIEMDEEQLTSLKLHIRKNIEGLALNEEFDAIEVKSYFKGAKQSAFISFKPFETSFEHNRKNVVNCSKEKNNGWSCKKTLITTLLINENGRTVTLMKGNSISEAIHFVNRFLNSESIIVEDEEGKSKLENWKDTQVVTQDITWVKLESDGIREVGLLGGLSLMIKENDDGIFQFLSMHSFTL